MIIKILEIAISKYCHYKTKTENGLTNVGLLSLLLQPKFYVVLEATPLISNFGRMSALSHLAVDTNCSLTFAPDCPGAKHSIR